MSRSDLLCLGLLLLMLLGGAPAAAAPQLFQPSERCLACHNGLHSGSTEDASFGFEWRPSMMANSARDPYWQAAVRREILDFPRARASIEEECAPCHLPMPTLQARAEGRRPEIFRVLAEEQARLPVEQMARDGVSCSVCHQIERRGLGSADTFTGKFRVEERRGPGERLIYGPFQVDRGRQRVMQSSSEMVPVAARHLEDSGLCASCHTLFTHARAPDGRVVGRLPEQVPFLEWRHSAWARERSCQDCHMPRLGGRLPVSSVLGQPRDRFFRHSFPGGNFLMRRLLDRHRDELQVVALPQELTLGARRDIEQLEARSARLELRPAVRAGGLLEVEVSVQNLAGHKLPTAYPSRRVWLRLGVRSAEGQALFESGGLTDRGSIRGNANDEDPRRFEPHYQLISRPDQVQIYESIMGDRHGLPTTGLLSGVRYLKDNRLLPRGFAKASAGADIAVHGAAAGDADFVGGGDRVRYRVAVAGARMPLQVEAELWYQPIGYRWEQNLRAPGYRSPETARFARMFDSVRGSSARRLTGVRVQVSPP